MFAFSTRNGLMGFHPYIVLNFLNFT